MTRFLGKLFPQESPLKLLYEHARLVEKSAEQIPVALEKFLRHEPVEDLAQLVDKLVESIFKRLQIMTSCYVSFSHGANDVANAIGPVALVYWIVSHGNVAQKVGVPMWLLALRGLGISAGALLLGARVMKTVGEEITQLNNSRGFCIDFSTASTVLFASVLGLPISTTHVVVGSVVGVGTARGVELVNVGVLKNILISWFATVPVSALVSAGFYLLILRFI